MRRLIPALAIGALLAMLAAGAGVLAVAPMVNVTPSFALSSGQMNSTANDTQGGGVSSDLGMLTVDAKGGMSLRETPQMPVVFAYREGQIASTSFQYTGPSNGSLTWTFNAVSLRQVYSTGSLSTALAGSASIAFHSRINVYLVADGVGTVDSQQLIGIGDPNQGTQGCYVGSASAWIVSFSAQVCTTDSVQTNFPSNGMTKTLSGSQVVNGRSYHLLLLIDSWLYGATDGSATDIDVQTTAQGLSATASWAPRASTDVIVDITGFYGGSPTAGHLHQINPVRVMDTRTNVGLVGKFSDPINHRTARPLKVAGVQGIDPTATAVTGILTVVSPSLAGWLNVSPSSIPSQGETSSLNFGAGDIASNGVTVGLSSGYVYITLGSPGGQTNVIFDVTGYYTASASGAATFYTLPSLTPLRIFNTVKSGQHLTPHHATMVPVVSAGLVPDGAVAITANVTVVNPSAAGWLWIGADASPSRDYPSTSMVNFTAGDIRATGVTVSLYGGVVWVTLGTASGTADVIIDVTGYFKNDDRGGTFTPVTPLRIVDTRKLQGSASLTPQLCQTYALGAPFNSAIAVTGNLTATNESQAGWLAVLPYAASNPDSSTLNFPAGVIRANDFTSSIANQSIYVTFGP